MTSLSSSWITPPRGAPATGYFDIGALLALNGEWQQVDETRILMGDEVSGRTKAKILEGIQKRAGRPR